MTTIPKALADGLNVRSAERVVSASVNSAKWVVDTDRDARLFADALILTPPVPQALALLEAGEYPLPDRSRAALAALDYAPCIALMALLWEPPGVPAPGGVQLDGEPVAWIGDNTQKGISPDAYAVTIHAGAQFSRAYWHADSDLVAALLLGAAAPWIGVRVKTHQIHRWRYSQPTRTHDAPCLLVEGPPPLVFAGDAFAGPKIEGAALSGLAAAEALSR
jgi:predicted NAD/FAD-dependent oxidoreductase